MNHYLDHCTGQASGDSIMDGKQYRQFCHRAERCKRHLALRLLEQDNIPSTVPLQMVDAEKCMDNGCIMYLGQ